MARVLVIDDEELVLDALGRLLERAGHEVFTAGDAATGESLYRQKHPDVAIIDILMPQKDGIAAIISLRNEFPDAKIIAISGGGKTGKLDFLPAAQHLGAIRTFVKPFNPSDLIDAVAEATAKPS